MLFPCLTHVALIILIFHLIVFKIVNIQEGNGEKIDFQFTNLMLMFVKVVVKAPRSKKYKKIWLHYFKKSINQK